MREEKREGRRERMTKGEVGRLGNISVKMETIISSVHYLSQPNLSLIRTPQIFISQMFSQSVDF